MLQISQEQIYDPIMYTGFYSIRHFFTITLMDFFKMFCVMNSKTINHLHRKGVQNLDFNIMITIAQMYNFCAEIYLGGGATHECLLSSTCINCCWQWRL